MEITTRISRLPDSPLFRQVRAYLGKAFRKIEIEFESEAKDLGYIGITGVVTVARITPAGRMEGWRSYFSDDSDSIETRDVAISDDVCFVEVYRVGRESWAVLHLNPCHLPSFEARVS